MANERESLDDLRREIDEIDERVHDLLINRAGLVERIRAVKRLESIATVRPGREALILRKLIARHQGRFPIGAITRIWREIIAGITRMEMSSYAVAVYAAEGDQGYWDIARDQFGSVTPMTPYSSPRDVLRIVDEGNASLGIVPVPRDDDTDPWWISLMIRVQTALYQRHERAFHVKRNCGRVRLRTHFARAYRRRPDVNRN